MKIKPKITVILGVLIGIFILLAGFIWIPVPHTVKQVLFPIAAILAIIFFVLGVILIIQTLKKRVRGALKWFLIITGISSAAVFPCVILHNLVYGLFIYWFGEGFWERIGLGDEPFFFITALIICPIAFLIGSIGSVVLLIKKRRMI